MITSHEVFSEPRKLEQKIWRYMDFTKFIDMINSSSLYFSRADNLGDPFEGSLPRRSVLVRKLQIDEEEHHNQINVEAILKHFEDSAKDGLTRHAVSCWHMNDYESMAMWKLYSSNNESIAIQTTYQKLKSELINNPIEIMIGTVNYIDYDVDVVNWGNGFVPFIHKRKSFEHEKELRAIIWQNCGENSKYVNISSGGIKIACDLGALIENVVVSPFGSKWFFSLIKDITIKYKFTFNVKESSINTDPVF